MEIKDTHLVYFSPTHTGRSVGRGILRDLDLTYNELDLTYPLAADVGEYVYDASDLAVVVVPVYGGHVAPVAALRLNVIKGNSTPSVAVVVYGNRAYEHALEELAQQLSAQGFSVIACATFIGEHSYSTEKYPISAGRPDAADLEKAAQFGKDIYNKVKNAAGRENLYEVDARMIPRPKQPMWPLLKFVYRVGKLRKSGRPMPKTPTVDASLCTHCGTCVSVCPNDAIQLGDELNTNPRQCVRCCACVKSCPVLARVFESPFGELLSRSFKREKEPCTHL